MERGADEVCWPGSAAKYVAGVPLRRGSLFFLPKVGNFVDMLCRVHQFEADALAVTTGRKAPAFDDRHLVRHVLMLRIVSDAVDARFRDDLAGVEFLRHG